MAFIPYADESKLSLGERVADPDNILQIHRIHPLVMRLHHDLYLELMHRPGPLTRRQREAIAVRGIGVEPLSLLTASSRGGLPSHLERRPRHAG